MKPFLCFLLITVTMILITEILPVTTTSPTDRSQLLEPIRRKHDAPALAALLIDVNGELAIGATGIRKIGSDVVVTNNDHWHLGSNTKAMTATLVGRLVEARKLSWEDTLGKIFPDLDLQEHLKPINFLHLLTHHAGIPRFWYNLTLSGETMTSPFINTVIELNRTVDKLYSTPGEEFVYSNWGYAVVGAMIERVTGETYEKVIQRELFEPLGMTSAGFGPTSENDELTQPWGHSRYDVARQVDITLKMSPAGSVHCSLSDWGKFIRDHLRGELGLPALLLPETYKVLHKAVHFTSGQALGFVYISGAYDYWAQGPIFRHSGSNGLYVANVVIDPESGVATMAATNHRLKEDATKEAIKALVEEYKAHGQKNGSTKLTPALVILTFILFLTRFPL